MLAARRIAVFFCREIRPQAFTREPMNRALRTPSWLNVLIGVLAIAVSILLAVNSRSVHRLRVEILSNSPVVSINAAIAKEMEVRYKGVPVQTLSLILLKFTNAGNQPIRETDYSEPIRVSLSQSAAVGEVSVQETQPDSIRLTPTATGNQVELARVLLNPGDQAVLKILALNNDSTLKVSARIAGISTIEVRSVLGRNELPVAGLLIALMYVLIAMLIAILPAYFIWNARSVIAWRRERFGFDPSRYYYTAAQAGMLTLPASKGTDHGSSALASVMSSLDKCLSWDIGYLERIMSDPLFAPLLGYERFKDVVSKHKPSVPDSAASTREVKP